MKEIQCGICEANFTFRWTDTHGVAACVNCGAPYRIYHYELVGEKTERVEKPPELLIAPEYLDLSKTYWREHHRNIAPGIYNFPGSSYEVASKEDFQIANDWWKRNKPSVTEKRSSN